MVKSVYTTNTNDRNQNDDLANLNKSGLSDFKNDSENMSEVLKTKWDSLYCWKKTLAFNDRTQRGQRLKILTPDQMLSRLPIFLAQLKEGNNSDKL